MLACGQRMVAPTKTGPVLHSKKNIIYSYQARICLSGLFFEFYKNDNFKRPKANLGLILRAQGRANRQYN
jgi:hypothetical protein